MAELNDKLITYGNLSTFYNKLQEQGLGGNAIEDASVLPDASENKNKFYRLSTDDVVYVSELKSRIVSAPTDRLPDAQQIDKAYINYSEYEYAWKYKGDGYKIICSDGEINGYGWVSDERPWCPYVSLVNAENLQDFKNVASADNVIFIDENNFATIDDKTFSTSDSVEFTKENHLAYDVTYVPAIYNAPEANQIGNATIEFEWWESGTTYNDTFVYDGTPETITVNNEQFTGYKWVSDDYPNIHMLTNLQASNIYHSTFYSEQHGYSELAPELYCYAVKNGVSGYCSVEHIIIPQLNAPDSEQVGNASFDDDDFGGHPIYEGVETSITVDGEVINVYTWKEETSPDVMWYTNVPATNIYAINDADYYIYDNSYREVDIESVMNLSTVKYQRTEVTEDWDWQPLTDNATNDDIDLMFASEIKLIRYQDAEQQAEGFVDMWVNTSGETMEYDGNTYYKWVSWANDGSEGAEPAVENPDYVMLTNTLNISLPFNSESPEYEYTISYDSEGDTWSDNGYFHGDYTQKTVQ